MKIGWIAMIAGLCGALSFARAQEAASVWSDGIYATRSVWSGVYTEAQAARGKADYWEDECRDCHGNALEGEEDEGFPSLTGNRFLIEWDKQSVADLARHMHSMPIGNPGDIDTASATDLIAYILASNKIPAGKAPLPQDWRVLDAIRMEAQPPAGGEAAR